MIHTITVSFLIGFTHGMTHQKRAAPLDAFLGVWMLREPPGDPHKVQLPLTSYRCDYV